MNWWNSFEFLSKAQTFLAVCVSIMGVVTLSVKLRADQLKKAIDLKKSEERKALDSDLKRQTDLALDLTSQLELRTRPKTPEQRLVDFLNRLNPEIVNDLKTKDAGYLDMMGDDQIAEFESLLRLPELSPHLKRLTPVDPSIQFFTDGSRRTKVSFVVRKSLIESIGTK